MSKYNQNVALIGCGYWGSILAKNLKKIIKKKIYIYDIDKKNLKNLSNQLKGLIPVNNISDIYKNDNIKNIFLATPPSKNFKILKNLIHYKKNIFVEKPFLNNLNHLKKIKGLLIKNKNIFMVGYVYIYNEIIQKIKKIIKSKKLGEILYIKTQRENLGPIRNDMDCNYDLASHDIAIITYLLNVNLKIISKKSHYFLKKNISDISLLELKYKNTKIDIQSSWLNPEKVRKLVIIGTKKMLLFDELNNRETLKIFDQYAEYPKITQMGKKILSEKARIYRGKYISVPNEFKSPVINEIKHFFECVKNKKTPITNFKFSENILKILSKINRN